MRETLKSHYQLHEYWSDINPALRKEVERHLKWGNSPVLRLSAAAMKLANFDLDQRVTIKAEKGRIVIEPCDKVEYKLEDLMAIA